MYHELRARESAIILNHELNESRAQSSRACDYTESRAQSSRACDHTESRAQSSQVHDYTTGLLLLLESLLFLNHRCPKRKRQLLRTYQKRKVVGSSPACAVGRVVAQLAEKKS